MAKITTPTRLSEETRAALNKEFPEKGHANLSAYLEAIIENRNAVSGGEKVVYKADPDQQKKISDQEKEIQRLTRELAEAKKTTPVVNGGKLAEHYAKRAWEISRITKEQLERGYDG